MSCRVDVCGRGETRGVERRHRESRLFTSTRGEERMEGVERMACTLEEGTQCRVSCMSRRVCRQKEKGLRATKDQSILPTHTSQSLKLSSRLLRLLRRRLLALPYHLHARRVPCRLLRLHRRRLHPCPYSFPCRRVRSNRRRHPHRLRLRHRLASPPPPPLSPPPPSPPPSPPPRPRPPLPLVPLFPLPPRPPPPPPSPAAPSSSRRRLAAALAASAALLAAWCWRR